MARDRGGRDVGGEYREQKRSHPPDCQQGEAERSPALPFLDEHLRKRVYKHERKETAVHEIQGHYVAVWPDRKVALSLADWVVVRWQRLGDDVEHQIDEDASDYDPESIPRAR